MKALCLFPILILLSGCTIPSSAYHGFRLSSRHWAAVLPERYFVQVTFDSVPSGASVEVGGFYVGSGRVTRPLEVMRSFPIRITKPGFEPWTANIIAETGLVVSPELTPVPPAATGGSSR